MCVCLVCGCRVHRVAQRCVVVPRPMRQRGKHWWSVCKRLVKDGELWRMHDYRVLSLASPSHKGNVARIRCDRQHLVRRWRR